jgi:hypothetical protein
MTTLTRGSVILDAQNLNDETEDKPGYMAPFLYSKFVDDKTDELARLDAYFVTYSTDIVSGQMASALPALYRSTDLVATWPSGASRALSQITPQDMDIRYAFWRSNPAMGWPTESVFQGINNVLLYPQPNYTLAGGLSIEGYGVPSSAGAGGVNVWPNMADPFPLPESCYMGVVYGVAAMRAKQFYPEKFAMWNDEFIRHKRMLFRTVQEASRGTRTGDGMETGPIVGAGY